MGDRKREYWSKARISCRSESSQWNHHGNIIDKIDHRNINLEVDFMKGKMISTENLAISIWEQIEPHIRKLNVELHSIKVQETENNYAEYFGN